MTTILGLGGLRVRELSTTGRDRGKVYSGLESGVWLGLGSGRGEGRGEGQGHANQLCLLSSPIPTMQQLPDRSILRIALLRGQGYGLGLGIRLQLP